ncbi:hypothetical protein ACN47A_29770 [Myxococcus fulvus]|uniref:hypothetical protein n=1 Tax=Myxococcus fulvus TaxID=33 RepID=UPI003B99DA9F
MGDTELRIPSSDAARSRGLAFSPTLVAVGAVVLVMAVALPQLLARVRDSNFHELAASIQDDSFYYLLPAFHFKSKLFFTFDGITPSYGFQPMYELVLAGLALFFSDFESFFRGAMTMGLVLHVLTSVLITCVVLRAVDARASWLQWVQRGAAVVAGLFYFTRGTVLLNSMTLKENALTSFVLAGVLLIATAQASSAAERRRLSMWVGLSLSALLLCRMLPTTLVVLGVVGLMALWRWRRPGVLFVSFVLPLVLWFGYATLAFGHPLPMSARVKALGSHSAPITWDVISNQGWAYLKAVFTFAVGLPSKMFVPQVDAGLLVTNSRQGSLWLALTVVALAALVAAAVMAAVQARRSRESSPGPGTLTVMLLAALTAGILAAYVAQGSLIATRRPGEDSYYIWYLFDLPVLLSVSLGLAVARGLSTMENARQARREQSSWKAPSVLVATLGGVLVASALAVFIARVPREYRKLSALQPYATFNEDSQAWQHTMIRAGLWLKQNVQLQPGERVACFSCGALGMLFPGAVLNLDGLANDEAGRFTLDRTTPIARYVEQVRPRYYIDVHTWHFDDSKVEMRPLHILPFPYQWKPGYVIAELVYREP